MTSADLNLRLIALVKKHPILYDSKHEKSKDKKAVAGTWSIISKEVGISVSECTDRWQLIRARFSAERRKTEKTGKKSNWSAMDHLAFLDSHVKKRKASVVTPMKKLVNMTPTNTKPSLTMSIESLKRRNPLCLAEHQLCRLDEVNEKLKAQIRRIKAESSDSDSDYDLKRPKQLPNLPKESLGVRVHRFDKINTKQSDENHEIPDEDLYVRNFCISLASDLRCINNQKNLLKCKIEIMEVIEKYLS